MHAFWRHGYETTSIADLTAAMGVTPPSLYAAFGDKKRLFLEAVRLYVGDLAAIARAVDAAPTARDAAEAMLRGSAHAFTGEGTPAGCLLSTAAATGSASAADVRGAVTEVRDAIRGILQARIERDVAAGILPPGADAAALAGLVVAITVGLSTLARDGAARPTLEQVAMAGLAGWPGERTGPLT